MEKLQKDIKDIIGVCSINLPEGMGSHYLSLLTNTDETTHGTAYIISNTLPPSTLPEYLLTHDYLLYKSIQLPLLNDKGEQMKNNDGEALFIQNLWMLWNPWTKNYIIDVKNFTGNSHIIFTMSHNDRPNHFQRHAIGVDYRKEMLFILGRNTDGSNWKQEQADDYEQLKQDKDKIKKDLKKHLKKCDMDFFTYQALVNDTDEQLIRKLDDKTHRCLVKNGLLTNGNGIYEKVAQSPGSYNSDDGSWEDYWLKGGKRTRKSSRPKRSIRPTRVRRFPVR